MFDVDDGGRWNIEDKTFLGVYLLYVSQLNTKKLSIYILHTTKASSGEYRLVSSDDALILLNIYIKWYMTLRIGDLLVKISLKWTTELLDLYMLAYYAIFKSYILIWILIFLLILFFKWI